VASPTRPRVHLIDGHVWIFRAYYALPAMAAPDGTPTHAAYGFTSTLIKYLAEQAPTHVGVAFDYALTSFRNEIEPTYKEDRTEAPPDLEPQFDLCVEAAEALGVATFEVEGYEADDLIATLAERLASRSRRGPGGRSRVVVVSSDKDLAQLVREDGSVVLRDNARGETLDAAGVRRKFGVDPAQIPDYLGLVGDPIDSLPGVPGVGAKGAAALLAAFGSIEAIPADPAAWEGLGIRGARRLAAAVAGHREQALRTRALATVVRDAPGVRADLRHLAWRGPDPARVEALFSRLGWGRLRDRVPGAPARSA